jgi:hypothetical protein
MLFLSNDAIIGENKIFELEWLPNKNCKKLFVKKLAKNLTESFF